MSEIQLDENQILPVQSASHEGGAHEREIRAYINDLIACSHMRGQARVLLETTV
jgi:hypothetical protein